MAPDSIFLIVAWTFGLFGAVLGILAVWYMHKAYQNMKGGKLGHAMRKIMLATVFVIFGMLNLGLSSSRVIPHANETIIASGLLAFLAGVFFFWGYRELHFLTEP